jgi:hypothetical protein
MSKQVQQESKMKIKLHYFCLLSLFYSGLIVKEEKLGIIKNVFKFSMIDS